MLERQAKEKNSAKVSRRR